jgi:serine/threonine protein kinase
LKPDNVMLVHNPEHGQLLVKVLDFGIAKLTSVSDVRLTRNGEIIGTPLYMAPEQLGSGEVGARADIYALGVIGYELVTGQVPFEAQSTMELFGQVLHQPVPPLRQKAPHLTISEGLEALLMRCLAKEPARRYQSALELREALHALGQRPDVVPLRAADDALLEPDRDALAYASTEELRGLQLSIFDTSSAITAWRRSRRRFRTRAAGVAFVVLGTSAVAAASVFDWVPLPEAAESVLRPRPPESADPNAEAQEPLALREWVQGMPFPVGTRYVRFESALVEAYVPARPERVAEFYRSYLGTKWGGFRELPDGFTFVNPQAPVERLTLSPTQDGCRLLITRKQLARR